MIVALTANTSWYLFNFRASTITALLEQGHNVICLAPEDEFSHRLRELGARYVPLRMDAAGTHLLRELWLICRMYRLVRLERPDCLFNFTVKMNVYFGLIARFLRIPYANNVSGLGTAFLYDGYLFRQVQKIYGWVNRGAIRVFFQNPDDRDLFMRDGLLSANRVTLLPGSGVDVLRFACTPLPQQSPFTFLMIARLIADKGVREFVEAAVRVRARNLQTRFVLIGPEGVRNRSAISESEIGRWREAGIVELPGAQDDVLPWLRQCHTLVLPSYREGMPRTVLEAAAVGRPAIVSDVPGCRQAIVPEQTGWLCQSRSVDSLATVMESVLERATEDPGWLDSFGKRAAERARARFSEERVVEAYLETVRSIRKKRAN